jgi:hypothetical protein
MLSFVVLDVIMLSVVVMSVMVPDNSVHLLLALLSCQDYIFTLKQKKC